MAQPSQTRGLRLPSAHLPLHGGPKAGRNAVGNAAAFARACAFHFQMPGVGEEGIEAVEEDRLLAALTQTIARCFLTEDDSAEVVVSPRAAVLSASDKGTPNGPSSPPPVEKRKEPGGCDLPYEAASHVMRLRRLSDLRRGQSLYAGGMLGPARKPAPQAVLGAPENVTSGYYASDPVLSPQQLQAAHFYHLMQQQSMKQPPAPAPWGRQSAVRGCGGGYRDRGRPLDLPPPAWPPLPQHAAMFLHATAARKESIGTGVFLPRVASSRNNNKLEPRRKSACLRDTAPERTVRALNLNLDELAAPQHFPCDADAAAIAARGSKVPSHPKNNHLGAHQPPSAYAAAQEIVLPQEWTY